MNKRRIKDLLSIADLALKQIEQDIYANRSLTVNECEQVDQLAGRSRNNLDEIRDLVGIKK